MYEHSEGNFQPTSVNNQNSVDECKKEKGDQSSLGLYNEDCTFEGGSQQGDGDDVGYYSNVHIGPDSEDGYLEYHYGPNPSDHLPQQKPRRQFIKPEAQQNTYYGMVIKNHNIVKFTTKRLLSTCTNLRFEPDGRQPVFLSELINEAHCEVWNARIEVDNVMRILDVDRRDINAEYILSNTKSVPVKCMNVTYVYGAKLTSNLIYQEHRAWDQMKRT